MTHTPGYGALIALGMLNSLKRLNNPSEEIEAAEAYLEYLTESGRFLTFAGGRAADRGHGSAKLRASAWRCDWSARPQRVSW